MSWDPGHRDIPMSRDMSILDPDIPGYTTLLPSLATVVCALRLRVLPAVHQAAARA